MIYSYWLSFNIRSVALDSKGSKTRLAPGGVGAINYDDYDDNDDDDDDDGDKNDDDDPKVFCCCWIIIVGAPLE